MTEMSWVLAVLVVTEVCRLSNLIELFPYDRCALLYANNSSAGWFVLGSAVSGGLTSPVPHSLLSSAQWAPGPRPFT